MRIACPTCNAAYDVPPAQLAPGRSVRCARCTETWVPVETADATPMIVPLPEAPRLPPREPASPVATAPEPRITEVPPPTPAPASPPPSTDEPEPTLAEPSVPPAPRLRRRAPHVAIGWLITVLVLAELAYVVKAYPTPIMQAWPAARRAYALFGVQPQP